MPGSFFNKVADCNFTKKESLAQVFSCGFCEISKNIFFTEHLRTTTSQRTQTSLRRIQDVLKKSRRVTTKQDVATTSGKRRRIYDVLKTSDLPRLEDVQFTTSWKRLIYNVFRSSGLRRPEDGCLRHFETSSLGRLEDVRFASSWRCPIYDVLKMSD